MEENDAVPKTVKFCVTNIEPLTIDVPITVCEPLVNKLPVISYEPLKLLPSFQTDPDLISKSPYELVVVVSRTSCNSPNSQPLLILTKILPTVACILSTKPTITVCCGAIGLSFVN